MEKKVTYNVIPFIQEFNYIAITDLDEILETLQDMGCLSEAGIEFRSAFWKLFINTERREDIEIVYKRKRQAERR